PRAKKAGMEISFDYAGKDGALPLPATLVKALGESIAKEYPGTAVRLLSNHPFPHRAAQHKLDEFQSAALAALEKDEDTGASCGGDRRAIVNALRRRRRHEGGLRRLPQQSPAIAQEGLED